MRFPGFIAVIVLVFGMADVSWAKVEVQTSLSQNETTVGEEVDLKIDLSGGGGEIRMSSAPSVDGVLIGRARLSQSYQITPGGSSSIVSLIFPVEPQREGTFTIPPIRFQFGGEIVETQAVTLKATGTPAPDRNTIVGEIWVPKTSCYVGELLPVEVRLLLSGRIEARMQRFTGLDGESYTKQKTFGPRQTRVRKGDREVNAEVLQTAISPSRAGKVTLGPTQLGALVSIPRAKKARDPFGDDFFNNPFGMFSATEERAVPVAAVDLDVKPLPVAGKPKDFSGAVGQFQLSVEGSPKQVKVGDPVTMKLRITGKGNFDRVNAPVLVDETGWHPYPPSSDFKPADELAISGAKTFEIAVVPEVTKVEMPRFQFSYFDPDAEKYVTLTTEPASLMVIGGAPSPPPVAVVSENSAPPAPTPAKQIAADILGLKYEAGTGRRSFEPVWRSRGFLLAQSVPGIALLALLGVRFLRKDEAEIRNRSLRKERAALWRALRGEVRDEAFFETAARLVQVNVALATGLPGGAVDAAAARASRRVDDETAKGLDEIFTSRAALLYAGGGAHDESISATDRARVLTTLERFEKADAHD